MTPNEALATVPILRRLRPEQISAVARACTTATFGSGDVVQRQGEIGQTLYVVLAGSVDSRAVARTANAPRGATLGPGDFFGEAGMLEPTPSTTTVTVREPSHLLALTQVHLVAAMRRDPDLAIAIARGTALVARGAHLPHDSEELKQLRAQMLLYADDLKNVYEDERARAAQLRESMMDTIRILINSIESKDPRQVGHGGRVARYAQITAREVGWSEERAVQAAVGGLIHDIGQVSLPDRLMRRRGTLTRDEITETRQHPELGARLLRGIKALEPLLPYVLSHHENFDGTGYPQGLRSNDIPIEARLIAVADAFDEIRTPIEATEADVTEIAVRELRKLSGNRLDPELLDAFLAAHRAGKLAV